jgi:HEAT repeat protein
MTLANARYAVALARAVDLLRKSPEPGEPQKAALHALVALTAKSSATFRLYAGELTVDGWIIPIADPRLAEFAKRLADQDVAEIVIAQGAGPDELLALARGLAADAGMGRIKEKLRDAGSTRIMVVMHQPLYDVNGGRSVAEAFAKVKFDQAVTSQWNEFLEHGAKAESERMASWGSVARGSGDVGSAPGAAATAQPPAAVPPATAVPAVPPAEPPPSPQSAEPPTLQADSPLGAALAGFVADPYGPDTLARLTRLSRQVQDAFSQDRVAEAIDAVSTLVDLEAKAPDPRVRGHYAVSFGLVLTRTSLEKAAIHLLEPRRQDRVATVLRRSPELAAELLVTLLTDAHTLGERIRYFAVLRDLPRGTDRLLALISTRTDWQATRNLVEVAGEARVDAAVPYLARFLEDHDERLRRAALVAMAKIGSTATTEPLRDVLKAGTPELRSLVVSSIGGPHARPLAALLAAHAERERNPDILRECFRALGRIGTPEAIEALEGAAGRRATFSRRTKAARAAAGDVLRALGRGEPPQVR